MPKRFFGVLVFFFILFVSAVVSTSCLLYFMSTSAALVTQFNFKRLSDRMTSAKLFVRRGLSDELKLSFCGRC